MSRSQPEREVIGLVPTAGRADRLGALPCSKEIFPLGFRSDEEGVPRPHPACGHVLESFACAGVTRAFFLLRKGKWDIPQLLGDGSTFGLPLAYLALEPTASVPETLDHAFPFVGDATVALGFPDIIVEPQAAFQSLLVRLNQPTAQVVLGLFPTDQSWKADMVELDEFDRARRIVIKQAETSLRFTWSIAVWTPDFSRYLHDFVARDRTAPGTQETYVGDVIQAAIDDGMMVECVRFEDGSFIDVGTPADLHRATARFVPAEGAE